MQAENKKEQYKMHKDFFDRCYFAIESGFYMEAILMEYAAIESRLEVIMGVIGLPCNKYLNDVDRRKINISSRIDCLKKIRKETDIFINSKLPPNFFANVKKWINNRNQYIHGLYKNELKYTQRIANANKMAKEGLEISRLLYNEANRLKRRHKKNEKLGIDESISCPNTICFSSKI